jgi:catechol 2,3-dioxygenase-like lactoylglutathione lyase family enzyme
MPPTLTNGKVCYIEIPATDVPRSAAFYEAVFGWQIRQRGDGHTAFDDSTGEVSGTWVLADRGRRTRDHRQIPRPGRKRDRPLPGTVCDDVRPKSSGGEPVRLRSTGRELEEVSSRPVRDARLLDELCPEGCSTGSAVVTPERGGEGKGGPYRLSTGKAGIAIVHGLNLASPGVTRHAAVWHLKVRLARPFSLAMKRYRLIGRDGLELRSATPGTLGGHRHSKVYGRLPLGPALDRPGPLRAPPRLLRGRGEGDRGRLPAVRQLPARAVPLVEALPDSLVALDTIA